MEAEERSKRLMAGAGRLIVAALLAYMFVIVLMTASAQSEVGARLKAAKVDSVDYAAGYALLADADAKQRAAAKKRAQRDTLAAAFRRSEKAYVAANDYYLGLEEPLQAVLAELEGAGICKISHGEALIVSAVGTALDRMESCAGREDVPAALRREAELVLKGKEALLAASKTWLKTRIARDDDMKALEEVEQYLGRADKAEEAVRALRAPFSSVAVLRDSLMLGGGLLVPLPPSLMQIILSFFSGLFGALLVTLVLAVYPNNDLGITTPGGNYGERILLGGLIAVCVFVVVGGGAAVLGSTNSFADGTANFQAFSAIGVLAGMFSDRVAQWLSDRATHFYGDDKDGAGAGHAQGANGPGGHAPGGQVA